jgi:peptidoglycan/xylan/chitin deacetylase (PgdA/CDA1 family)
MLARAMETLQRPIRKLQKSLTSRGLILMYHRVASEDMDPWALRVTPQQFHEHLQVLQQYTNPISLQELAAAHREGNVPERACAITFDDGYANNLYNAKPLLAQQNVPATVFVTTAYTNQNQEFWWDELEQILLHPGQLPAQLELCINDKPQRWTLGQAARYSELDYQRDCSLHVSAAQPGGRLAFYYSVWQALQPLEVERRQHQMGAIRTWAQVTPSVRPSHRPMTSDELVELETGNLIELGAHTVNHPLLSQQETAQQLDEISRSKASLEAVLGHSVVSFAYPFGVYGPETPGIVRAAGFHCACSVFEETVWNRSDAFQLPRFEVRGCSGQELENCLQTWFQM